MGHETKVPGTYYRGISFQKEQENHAACAGCKKDNKKCDEVAEINTDARGETFRIGGGYQEIGEPVAFRVKGT
jgi:hypothetical protein